MMLPTPRRATGKVPRDRFWVWAHPPGAHNGKYNLPGLSRITPAQGAQFLGLEQILMVRFGDRPTEPLAGSLSGFPRVVWSAVGAGGRTSPEEREAVLTLATRHPNIRGLVFDDFWEGAPGSGSGVALTLPELELLRTRATNQGLDLWSVLYVSEFFRPVVPTYLPFFDRHTLWCYEPQHARDMDDKLSRFRRLVPDKPRYMGVYLWDYAHGCPMPLGRLQSQCRCGLDHLLSGDLAGMIFLPTCVLDLGLESATWVRDWLESVAG